MLSFLSCLSEFFFEFRVSLEKEGQPSTAAPEIWVSLDLPGSFPNVIAWDPITPVESISHFLYKLLFLIWAKDGAVTIQFPPPLISHLNLFFDVVSFIPFVCFFLKLTTREFLFIQIVVVVVTLLEGPFVIRLFFTVPFAVQALLGYLAHLFHFRHLLLTRFLVVVIEEVVVVEEPHMHQQLRGHDLSEHRIVQTQHIVTHTHFIKKRRRIWKQLRKVLTQFLNRLMILNLQF